MRRSLQLATILLLLLSAGKVRAGEVVDRIVATVDRHAILQSELSDATRLEMFEAGRPLNSVTLDDLRSALNRMIDQELIRKDIGKTDAFAPSSEDVEKRVADIRAQIPEASTETGWQSTLRKYGLSEAMVRERVRDQLETMRMVNQRLRPSVRVDQTEIETTYQNEFLPKLRQSGAKEVPLSEVSARIRQLLVERHIGELLDSWLQGLRQQANVRIQVLELRSAEAPSGTAGSGQSKIDGGDAQ